MLKGPGLISSVLLVLASAQTCGEIDKFEQFGIRLEKRQKLRRVLLLRNAPATPAILSF